MGINIRPELFAERGQNSVADPIAPRIPFTPCRRYQSSLERPRVAILGCEPKRQFHPVFSPCFDSSVVEMFLDGLLTHSELRADVSGCPSLGQQLTDF